MQQYVKSRYLTFLNAKIYQEKVKKLFILIQIKLPMNRTGNHHRS